MHIDLQIAKSLSDAASSAAQKIGRRVAVAVVDDGGFPVLIQRMDGALPLTPAVALAKAHTAAMMRLDSHRLRAWADREPAFFAQVSTLAPHPLVATEGGVTVATDNTFLGGLGVSGGTGAEDLQICNAALVALGFGIRESSTGS